MRQWSLEAGWFALDGPCTSVPSSQLRIKMRGGCLDIICSFSKDSGWGGHPRGTWTIPGGSHFGRGEAGLRSGRQDPVDLSPGQFHSHSPSCSGLLSLLTRLPSPQVLLCTSGPPPKKAKEAEETTDEDAQLPTREEKAVGAEVRRAQACGFCAQAELLRVLTEAGMPPRQGMTERWVGAG